jgi:uncharacterized protein (TIGR03067 family)
MKHRRLAGLVLFLAALTGCNNAPPGGTNLAGQWIPITAMLSGIDFPVSNFGSAKLQLTKDTYDFAGDKGTYTLFPEATPPKMDIVGTEGPNQGKTIPAIYKLEGGVLTICYQLGNGERPTEFVSPPGMRILLVSYKQAP